MVGFRMPLILSSRPRKVVLDIRETELVRLVRMTHCMHPMGPILLGDLNEKKIKKNQWIWKSLYIYIVYDTERATYY